MAQTLEVTLKLVLAVKGDGPVAVEDLVKAIEAAAGTENSSLGAAAWQHGAYVDAFVERVELTRVAYEAKR
jgi:hypothetical protein